MNIYVHCMPVDMWYKHTIMQSVYDLGKRLNDIYAGVYQEQWAKKPDL